MTPEQRQNLMELLTISADPARNLVNAVSAFHENEAIQALALLGASMAISKEAGCITREQFLEAATLIWDTGRAEFEPVTERAH